MVIVETLAGGWYKTIFDYLILSQYVSLSYYLEKWLLPNEHPKYIFLYLLYQDYLPKSAGMIL